MSSNMMNTFQKTQQQQARRIAIQRQMEAMEAAAAGRPREDDASSARSRASGAPGGIESARRFLWEDDDSSAGGPNNKEKPGNDQNSKPVVLDWSDRRGFVDDRRSLYAVAASGQQPATEKKGFFSSITGMFGSPFAQSSGQSDMNRNLAASAEQSAMIGSGYPSKDRNGRSNGMTAIRTGFASCMMTIFEHRARFAAALVILAMSIGVFMVISLMIGSGPNNSGEQQSGVKESPKMTEAALFRYNNIKTSLVDGGISTKQALEKEGSPQNMALDWIANKDPAEMALSNLFLPQRYALAVLYYGTHGDFRFQPGANASFPEEDDDFDKQDFWVSEENWMTGKGYCTWQGVKCRHREGHSKFDTTYDGHNDITVLNLTNTNVRGQFPEEMIALSSLYVLDISMNGFFGTLPKSLTKLKNINHLNIAANFFRGSFPDLSGWTTMTHMYMSENYITGTIPSAISALTDLHSFAVFDNYLNGTIPSSLGTLTKLHNLYLDENDFSGAIPKTFGNLIKLVDLRLRDNLFGGNIPTEIGDMTSLQILYLDTNALTGEIPPELSYLEELEELQLYENDLIGTLPPELADLDVLKILYLDNNLLEGSIPPEFGIMDSLQQLYLQKNLLTGKIPDISNMIELRHFRAFGNKLTGSIPSELGKLFKLEDLLLNKNQLNGKVPVEVGDLTRLVKLHIEENDITGTLPESICSLKDFDLQELVSDCSGSKPEILCTCCTKCPK
mmetsp:Transcript_20437/g.31161  ORF Transcript_20437/g.31161 Transcript_20437/m.31161 type:complete len:731 (+) Transcript_20437:117-2309(+)